jgi:hypothetical protein
LLRKRQAGCGDQHRDCHDSCRFHENSFRPFNVIRAVIGTRRGNLQRRVSAPSSEFVSIHPCARVRLSISRAHQRRNADSHMTTSGPSLPLKSQAPVAPAQVCLAARLASEFPGDRGEASVPTCRATCAAI